MFEKLVDIICNYVEVEPEDIRPESRFMEDLGFTSFDFMSMLGEIEDEFDVEVEQTEAVHIRTVLETVDSLVKLSAESYEQEQKAETGRTGLYLYVRSGAEERKCERAAWT